MNRNKFSYFISRNRQISQSIHASSIRLMPNFTQNIDARCRLSFFSRESIRIDTIPLNRAVDIREKEVFTNGRLTESRNTKNCEGIEETLLL